MGNILTRYQLLHKNEDNTPQYGFAGNDFIAKVVHVYDGDTCTAIVKLNGKFQQIKIRMFGYDSPELKPPLKLANRDQIIEKANAAKEALSKLVSNKIVNLHVHGFDKVILFCLCPIVELIYNIFISMEDS